MALTKRKSAILMYFLQAIGMFIAYPLLSSFSLFATKTAELPTSAFYIPAGLAVCSLMMIGPQFIPVIFLAKFLTSFFVGDYTLTRALMSSGASVIEAYVAWYLYKSFKKSIEEFFPYQSTLVLVSFMALVAAMASAIIGVTALYYHGIVTEQNYFANFINWYFGDILSFLIFIPLVVSFKYEKHRMLDFIFPFLAIICVSFFKYEAMSPFIFLLFFLLIIPCCLGSIMGIYYTSIALVIVLNWFFINYTGPFALGSSSENMVAMQLLLGSIAITALSLEGFRKTQLTKNVFISITLMWLLSGSVYYFYFNQKLSNDRLLFAKLRDDFELRMNDRMILIENTLLGATGFIDGSINVDADEWDSYIHSFFNTVKDKGVLGIGTNFVSKKSLLFNSNMMTTEQFKSMIQNERFKTTFNSALVKDTPVLSPFIDIEGKKISLLIKSITKNGQIVGWAIIPLELNSFFNSITDNRFLSLDIDIYETSEFGDNNLIYSKVVDPKMRKKMQLDAGRLTTISLAERTFYVDWNNTFRFSTRNNTKTSLFLLFGTLLSLIVTGSYLRLKLSLFNSRDSANQKNQAIEESALKYKLLFEEEVTPMVLFDENKIIDCNKRALKLFRRKTKAELLSLSVNSLFDFHSLYSDESASIGNFTILKKIKDMNQETFFEMEAFILIHTMPFPAQIQVTKLIIENHTFYKAKIKGLSHLSKKDLPMKQEFVERIISSQGDIIESFDANFGASDSNTKGDPAESTLKTREALPFQGQKILLVEDNQVNIIVTKKFLEKWGLTVEVAINGLDAIAKVKESNFSLILMDLHMPVMDGIEATKEIRKFNETTPIIGLSADVMSHGYSQFLSYGMNQFITKPFNPTNFRDILLKFIPQA